MTPMKSADYLRVMGAAPLLVALFFIMEHIGFPRLFTLSCIGISLWYIKNYEELTLAAWVQMMLSTVVEIFFREIDVLDKHKIPETGPVLFVCAPHANQFVDPLIIMRSIKRPVGFLSAAKTMRRKWVGKIAGAVNAIPVERPQDVAEVGEGTVTVSGIKVTGQNTKFTELFSAGWVLMVNKSTAPVLEIVSDTELVLKKPFRSQGESANSSTGTGTRTSASASTSGGNTRKKWSGVPYKALPKLDQNKVFTTVHEHLKDGKCIGIFPEGGSHDRTSLLPLKAGVAIMGLGAMAKYNKPTPQRTRDSAAAESEHESESEEEEEDDDDGAGDGDDYTGSSYRKRDPKARANASLEKHNNKRALNVKIVPIGLNYFHGHRFRSRAYVAVGDPITMSDRLVNKYREGGESKRNACAELLSTIQNSLSSVTTTAPDYNYLSNMWMLRRLYKPRRVRLRVSEKLELTRRFHLAFEQIKTAPRAQKLMQDVTYYNKQLKLLGITDHQLKTTGMSALYALGKLIYRACQLVLMVLFAIPGGILNSPVVLISRIVSTSKAKEATAKSVVKIAGRDVVATWKVMTSMTLVPLCFVVYPIIAAWYGYYYYGDWHGALTAWAYFAMFQPFISYGSVRVTEISMDVLKSLPPLFVAVGVSGNYKTIVKLRKLRSALKKEVHYLIDEYGPSQYGDEWEGKYIMEMQEFNFTDIDDSEDEGGY